MDDIRQYDALDDIVCGIGYDSRSNAEKKIVRKLTAKVLSEKGKSKVVKKLRARVNRVAE
jgi:hypothetical protein